MLFISFEVYFYLLSLLRMAMLLQKPDRVLILEYGNGVVIYRCFSVLMDNSSTLSGINCNKIDIFNDFIISYV